MSKVQQIDVPQGSLLADYGPPEAYRDCYAREVPGTVSLPEFIERFYCSIAFRPERLALGLIGRGTSNEHAARLARGEVESFAAWHVVERSDTEILLRDFQGATASWLSVEQIGDGKVPSSSSGCEAQPQAEPVGQKTRLLFGSWVGKPDRPIVRALMPFHRWYSKVLMGGAT